MRVYILGGYFGDQDWIEGVYATAEKAEEVMMKLWEKRDSENTPQHAKRVAKFGYDEWEVIE